MKAPALVSPATSAPHLVKKIKGDLSENRKVPASCRVDEQMHLMTLKEFCRRVTISRSSAYVHIQRGDLEVIKIGRATRISVLPATRGWPSSRKWGDRSRWDSNPRYGITVHRISSLVCSDPIGLRPAPVQESLICIQCMVRAKRVELVNFSPTICHVRNNHNRANRYCTGPSRQSAPMPFDSNDTRRRDRRTHSRISRHPG
jgi:hypothetical protein